jgi:iron-sulfur cluster assembly protein
MVLAGALAAGFAVGLVVGFLAGALATGIAAGLETFLAGTLAAGFFAGALAAVLAGALALGLETFFTDALEATGLGLAAAALLFEALAFGFAAFDLGLAVGDLAAGFLDEGLDEGMGDGRWKRSVWVYYSYSMGTAEFPQAGRTKRERFGCVKGILKNKFSAHPQTLGLARGDHPREVIFGFEFPCGWPTLRVEMITLTERAAAELKRLLASKGETEGVGLRLAVTKGGCAGWQYEMNVGQAEAGDLLVEDRGARVIVEADSVDRLRGCEIDFSDELSDSGFKIHNPRAARSCGCGTSFEPLDDPAAEDFASETKDCRA